jgi:hypothetical protein
MTMINLLKLLAGEWTGTGLGEYPTIASFEYLETLRFTLDETRPLLHYEQKTSRRNMGQTDFVPSHWETGFLYLLSDNQVEVANAQIGGRLEVLTGTIEPAPAGLVLRLQSSYFANDPRMQGSSRTITVDGDSLHYTMHMQTTKVPQLALHLEARLERQ